MVFKTCCCSSYCLALSWRLSALQPDNVESFDNHFDWWLMMNYSDDHYSDDDFNDDDLLGALSFLQFKRKLSGLLQAHVWAKLHLVMRILMMTVMTFTKSSWCLIGASPEIWGTQRCRGTVDGLLCTFPVPGIHQDRYPHHHQQHHHHQQQQQHHQHHYYYEDLMIVSSSTITASNHQPPFYLWWSNDIC